MPCDLFYLPAHSMPDSVKDDVDRSLGCEQKHQCKCDVEKFGLSLSLQKYVLNNLFNQ